MKSLVVYDSLYGNTAKIAQAVGAVLRSDTINISKFDPEFLNGLDVLVVGSPTQGGQATPAIKDFIASIPKSQLRGMGVTAFDTRISGEGNGIGIKVLVGILGFAAGRIANSLVKRGGRLLAQPEGFIVTGKEGPLLEGEIKRAEDWAFNIISDRKDFGDEL